MKSNTEIMKSTFEKLGLDFNSTTINFQRIIQACMQNAREEELNHIRQSVLPEEGKNGFNMKMFNEEIRKFAGANNQYPEILEINEADFLPFYEIEMAISGWLEPLKDNKTKISNVLVIVTNDVEPGHWKFSMD